MWPRKYFTTFSSIYYIFFLFWFLKHFCAISDWQEKKQVCCLPLSYNIPGTGKLIHNLGSQSCTAPAREDVCRAAAESPVILRNILEDCGKTLSAIESGHPKRTTAHWGQFSGATKRLFSHTCSLLSTLMMCSPAVWVQKLREKRKQAEAKTKEGQQGGSCWPRMK